MTMMMMMMKRVLCVYGHNGGLSSVQYRLAVRVRRKEVLVVLRIIIGSRIRLLRARSIESGGVVLFCPFPFSCVVLRVFLLSSPRWWC